jgi:hypothetical protein
VGAPFDVPLAVAPALGVAGKFVAGGAEELEGAETDALGAGCCGSLPAEPGSPPHPASGRTAVTAMALMRRLGLLAICLNAASTPDTVSEDEASDGRFRRC